ncbi:hypothetical protein B0J11DRAFT_585280 [Dendryphion nanum]|uniref:Uncharacterized protein n=1 Tax=Dendryphion nanum TaxID=256645 RepID=A0A9P9IAF7_9PLEO|nr:hypothetical protein B0J11DRAFT_585280 [Dendryphion nanum]
MPITLLNIMMLAMGFTVALPVTDSSIPGVSAIAYSETEAAILPHVDDKDFGLVGPPPGGDPRCKDPAKHGWPIHISETVGATFEESKSVRGG